MSLSNFLHENIHATYAPLLYVPWLISTYKYTDLKGFIFFVIWEFYIYPHVFWSTPPQLLLFSAYPHPTLLFIIKTRLWGLKMLDNV